VKNGKDEVGGIRWVWLGGGPKKEGGGMEACFGAACGLSERFSGGGGKYICGKEV